MRKLMMAVPLLLLAGSANAQTLMPEPLGRNSIGVELMRPILDEGSGVDALSFGSFISGRIGVRGVNLIAELPLAHAGDEFSSSSAIGNILLGVERATGPAELYVTARIPTASDNEMATFFGVLGDFQKLEAWVPDLWTFSAGGIMRRPRANGRGFDFHLGGVLMKPQDADNEVALDYGAQYVVRPHLVGFTAGIQGRALVSEDGSFAERTFHDLRLRLDYTFKDSIRPALAVTFPLDEEVREDVSWVVRLGVQIAAQ